MIKMRTKKSIKVYEFLLKNLRNKNYCLNGFYAEKVSYLISDMYSANVLQELIKELDLINQEELEEEIKKTEEKLKNLYENKNNNK